MRLTYLSLCVWESSQIMDGNNEKCFPMDVMKRKELQLGSLDEVRKKLPGGL